MGRASPMTYTLDGIRGALIEGRGLGAVARTAGAGRDGCAAAPVGLLTFGWASAAQSAWGC